MCTVTKIALSYEETVFEEQYRPKKFTAYAEFALGDEDDKNEVFKKGSKYLVDIVKWEIAEYAPNAKTHEELTSPRKGKHTDIIE